MATILPIQLQICKTATLNTIHVYQTEVELNAIIHITFIVDLELYFGD